MSDDVADLAAQLAGPAVAAIQRFLAGEDDGHRLRQIAVTGRLDSLEAAVLALLCAIEADPRRQRLVGYLHDDVTMRHLTPYLLQVLFADLTSDSGLEIVSAVGPGGLLRRNALIAMPDGHPWSATPISVEPSVMWALAGDTDLDQHLPPGATLVNGSDAAEGPRMITVAGPDRIRRIQAAAAALPCRAMLVVTMPTDPSGWEAVVRQAILADAAIMLEVDDDLPAAARHAIERADHLCWAIASRQHLAVASLPRRAVTDVAVPAGLLTEDEREQALGTGTAAGHRVTADQLESLSRLGIGDDADLSSALRRLAVGKLDAMATRIRPTRGFDDIVLDADRTGYLREIVARCRHRDAVFTSWGFEPNPSTGVVALFSGPSGTGKTLAAEIIAGELDMDLYKVDLSGLVSKYIGETEKNLAQVFETAEASNVALFFDEADAILGKRSEVSDAHDRYANIEVSYLLQRIERYDGLVILATNLPKNIDAAFTRRIHVSIEFPMPEEAERRRIWQHSFPATVPIDDVDLDLLAAKADLSGGSIRNAALTAAFLAIDAGEAINLTHLVAAIAGEYRKQGRLFDAAALLGA